MRCLNVYDFVESAARYNSKFVSEIQVSGCIKLSDFLKARHKL